VAKIGWLLCEEALENIGGKFPINPYLFIDDGGGGGKRRTGLIGDSLRNNENTFRVQDRD